MLSAPSVLPLSGIVVSFLHIFPSLSLSLSVSHPKPYSISQSEEHTQTETIHGRWFLLECSSLFRFQALPIRSSISIRFAFFTFPQFNSFFTSSSFSPSPIQDEVSVTKKLQLARVRGLDFMFRCLKRG